MRTAQEIFLSHSGGDEGWVAVWEFCQRADRDPLFHRILREALRSAHIEHLTVERVIDLGWPARAHDEL
jgi:hypothetical protein